MTAGGRGNVQKRVTQSCCFAYLNLFPFCRSLFGSHGIRLHWPFGKGKDRDVGAQENRGGGVRKANEERAGSGRSNRVGSGRNRGKLHNSA